MLRAVGQMLGLTGGFRRIENRAARIGVVDIGSNSVRLVVFDSATRSPAVFFNEKALCGLGAVLEREGRLAPEGRRSAVKALIRFRALAGRMRLDALDVIGTAAIRDALDGPDFVREVAEKVGFEIRVADGAQEARLSAQGVLLGEPDAQGVVADIGGASLELVTLHDGAIGEGVTLPLGPLRLKSVAPDLNPATLEREIDARLAATLDRMDKGDEGAVSTAGLRAPRTLYVVGGSWRALVKAYMAQKNYPLRVLHGFSLRGDEALKLARWGSRLSKTDFRDLAGVSDRRADVSPLAAHVLERLIAKLAPERLTLSAFGLREGVLWEHLPPPLREEDPLLGACAEIERRKGRMPGFGGELWAWLEPLFEGFNAGDRRLAEAACLLSDAAWSTHPDYRPMASFELVTRNNFGGVDHADRVFLGAALLHRFKGAKRAIKAEPAMALASAARLRKAEALGRGMRLGAVFAGGATGVLPANPLVVEEGVLTLRVSEDGLALDGDIIAKRLDMLRQSLGLRGFEIGRAPSRWRDDARRLAPFVSV